MFSVELHASVGIDCDLADPEAQIDTIDRCNITSTSRIVLCKDPGCYMVCFRYSQGCWESSWQFNSTLGFPIAMLTG